MLLPSLINRWILMHCYISRLASVTYNYMSSLGSGKIKIHQSYPDLSALHHFQELRRTMRPVAVEDKGEVASFMLPCEPLLVRTGIVGHRELDEWQRKHVV